MFCVCLLAFYNMKQVVTGDISVYLFGTLNWASGRRAAFVGISF